MAFEYIKNTDYEMSLETRYHRLNNIELKNENSAIKNDTKDANYFKYADYFNNLVYKELLNKSVWFDNAKMETNIPPTNSMQKELTELKEELKKKTIQLASITKERDYWHKIYCDFVIAIQENRLISNPNHPANQPQRQEHEVISALSRIGKSPHATRYSIIENGGQ